MPEKKPKFYVVWPGRKPGVYDSWDEAKARTDGLAIIARPFYTSGSTATFHKWIASLASVKASLKRKFVDSY